MVHIEMSRTEALALLADLPATHWVNNRVLKALEVHADDMIDPATSEIDAELIRQALAKRAEKDEDPVDRPRAATSYDSVNDWKNKQDIDLKFMVRERNEVTGCPWEHYGMYCNRPTENGKTYCPVHDGKKCSQCDRQSTHGCPVELQFVCGEPLCEQHSHRY
jgi:hypothetical protein